METSGEPTQALSAPKPAEANPVAENLKYIIFGGNHPEVVVEALHRRGNFEQVSFTS